ncbi:MAG: hypothetical protein ACREH8_00590, partial [Opitutaceae bacterium]
MKVCQPVAVTLPRYGVLFLESVHANDFRMAERAEHFHKLVYVLEGRITYREPRRALCLVAEKGTVIVVPRDVRHEIEDVLPSTLLLLCLTQNYLDSDPDLPRVWLDLARTSDRQLQLSRPGRLRLESMWRRAMLEKANGGVGGAVSVRSLAAQTVVLLARLPTRRVGDDTIQRVDAVIREISETFYDEWNLDRAATRAGLSRRRFSELFREVVGRTFGEHLNELRLNYAAQLL